MLDPFRDSWLKHNRALEHIQALSVELANARSAEAEPYTVKVNFETDAGCHVARFYEINAPHPRLGTIVGDILHNLRSALDVIAWKLALQHNARAAKRNRKLISFPLAMSEAQYASHDALPFFSERARTVIEGLQPYERGDGNPMQALGWLSRLSNADKHRVATGIFSGFTLDRLSYVVKGERPFTVKDLTKPGTPMKNGTPIAHITVAGPHTAQVRVENYPPPQILFASDQGQIGFTGPLAIHSAVDSALVQLGNAFGPARPVD